MESKHLIEKHLDCLRLVNRRMKIEENYQIALAIFTIFVAIIVVFIL